MDVSIIIVNYNTYDLTAACIQSIIEHTKRISYEIIVVDNASTDGSKEKFERDSRIKYIYSEKNGGFGYGNNRGIEIANGDYFFLLNSDTLLLNNAIYEFFKYAKSHKSRIIYGCYLQGNDGTYRNSFFYFPAFTIKEFFRRMIFPHNYEPDYTDKEVDCISGASMFIPRSAIDEAGIFDENIFLYGEEGELQYRMMKKGYKRMVITSPKIIHLEGESSGNTARKQYGMISHLYILKKYMNPITYLLAWIYYKVHS
ncbi:glycosyltransferase family 2 protein [Prevotella nigrescens]